MDRDVFSDADFHGADATDQLLQDPEPVPSQQLSSDSTSIPAAVPSSFESAEAVITHSDVIIDSTQTLGMQLSCDSACASNSNQLDQLHSLHFRYRHSDSDQ